MSLFNSITLTVIRSDAGSYVDGRFQNGVTSSFSITGSVQPATPSEMLLLPEGRREERSYKVYTSTKLRPVNDPESVQGLNDVITGYEGADWDLIGNMEWQNGIINHYEYMMMRKDVNP